MMATLRERASQKVTSVRAVLLVAGGITTCVLAFAGKPCPDYFREFMLLVAGSYISRPAGAAQNAAGSVS